MDKELANEIITLLRTTEKELFKFLSGTKAAARRARVKLIELEKKGLAFRKASVEKR